VIVLILFGAGKLPQVFEAFGQGLKKFREAQKEGEAEDPFSTDVTPKPKEIPAAPPQAPPAVEEAEEVVSEQKASGE
jgi:sec-independent protein translocase protein TatA